MSEKTDPIEKLKEEVDNISSDLSDIDLSTSPNVYREEN